MAQVSTLTGLQLAWPGLRNGSFTWNARLRPRAERLNQDLENAQIPPDAFAAAIEQACRQRIDDFLSGVSAYRSHPFHRALADVPVIWQDGTTRLLDYSLPAADGPPVLVIPSLINRSYILDLTERRSLMRHLAQAGLRPFLVDWAAPGPDEAGFGMDAYIAHRLSSLLDFLLPRTGRPVLLGYCMGGLFALALGLLRQDDVRGLAVLATPWDFHRPDTTQARMMASLKPAIDDALALFDQLPVDILQSFFSFADPASIERKFRAFAQLPAKSARARDFVALEDWLNDGVALTAPVAREALYGWYVDNLTAQGLWRVGSMTISPQRFVKPALALIPSADRIVPPASALRLAEALPNARIRMVAAGHIGMVAGARAKITVYRSLASWLSKATGSKKEITRPTGKRVLEKHGPSMETK